MAEHQSSTDQDAGKGAVEGDGRARTERGQSGNTSLDGQNPHRSESNLVKSNDTDFPEPGLSPEHSGNEERGTMNKHSQESSPKNRERQDVEIPAEGADIENRGPQKHGGQSPNREQANQDPGHRQKDNQNQQKDDPLAA